MKNIDEELARAREFGEFSIYISHMHDTAAMEEILKRFHEGISIKERITAIRFWMASSRVDYSNFLNVIPNFLSNYPALRRLEIILNPKGVDKEIFGAQVEAGFDIFLERSLQNHKNLMQLEFEFGPYVNDGSRELSLPTELFSNNIHKLLWWPSLICLNTESKDGSADKDFFDELTKGLQEWKLPHLITLYSNNYNTCVNKLAVLESLDENASKQKIEEFFLDFQVNNDAAARLAVIVPSQTGLSQQFKKLGISAYTQFKGHEEVWGFIQKNFSYSDSEEKYSQVAHQSEIEAYWAFHEILFAHPSTAEDEAKNANDKNARWLERMVVIVHNLLRLSVAVDKAMGKTRLFGDKNKNDVQNFLKYLSSCEQNVDTRFHFIIGQLVGRFTTGRVAFISPPNIEIDKGLEHRHLILDFCEKIVNATMDDRGCRIPSTKTPKIRATYFPQISELFRCLQSKDGCQSILFLASSMKSQVIEQGKIEKQALSNELAACKEELAIYKEEEAKKQRATTQQVIKQKGPLFSQIVPKENGPNLLQTGHHVRRKSF